MEIFNYFLEDVPEHIVLIFATVVVAKFSPYQHRCENGQI